MSILGRVTSVSAQDGRVFVSVQHDRPGVEDQNIPFMSQAAGMMVTPTEGDIVEIYELDGIGTVAGLTYNPPSFSMPDLGENEMVFKFNEDTQISFRESENGGYEVDISADGNINFTSGSDVNISTEGTTTVETINSDVSITSGGKVTVEAKEDAEIHAENKVLLGKSDGTLKPVARQGDPISGTGYQGASVSGQIDSGSSDVESS